MCSINQSNRSISVCLLFLYCSRVFISRSYENRSNYPDSEFHGHWKTVTLSSISPNLSKHLRFLAFWLSLCFGSCLLFLVCHYTAFLFSTRAMTTLGWLPNTHRDIPVTSWFNYWLALNLWKNDIFLIVSRFSVQHFLIFLQRHKKHENWLKIVK